MCLICKKIMRGVMRQNPSRGGTVHACAQISSRACSQASRWEALCWISSNRV